MAKRVVIAGLGDTGVLVAIYLGRGFDVVGISTKPCLVSGQELGTRLTRPEVWKQDYLMEFGRYERLDDVRVVHGRILGIDTKAKSLTVERPSGETQLEPYDALVISSGVTSWRTPCDFVSSKTLPLSAQRCRELMSTLAQFGRTFQVTWNGEQEACV